MTAASPRDRRCLIVLPLAGLAAILPLILHGCSCGHDFDFHLLSWIEAATQFRHGGLHPHWAYTPAWNAGEPRFTFYPPISWYLGALTGLILTHLAHMTEAAGWTAAPIVFTWIALTASGFALYRLAREFAAPNAALLAATLYLANPYMLFTAYERTAYAELLAAAWIPLLFLAMLRPRPTIPGIAVPLALLWLTNAPAAVMGTYTLAFLAIFRLATTPGAPRLASETGAGRHRPALTLALTTLAGTLLGLALAAFYILPAAAERPLVQIAMVNIAGMRIQDNFLFERIATSPEQIPHDIVLRTASIVAVLLLGLTAAALAAAFLRAGSRSAGSARQPLHRLILSLTVLAGVILFLLTPASLFLWSHAPEAGFLQFPWRILGILATVFALAAALALDRLRLNLALSAAVSLLCAAAVAFAAWHAFAQRCYPEDTAAALVALFHSTAGTDPTDEYTPTDADNDALAPGNPPFWLADSPLQPPPHAMPGATPAKFTVAAPHAAYLILNLRDIAHWSIHIDGEQHVIRTIRPDGLLALPVPAGLSTIHISYRGSRDEIEGDATTLLALPVFLFTLRRRRPR